MKTSTATMLGSVITASLVTGALWWYLPIFPWWVYLIIGAVLYAVGYDVAIKQAAAEKMSDLEK